MSLRIKDLEEQHKEDVQKIAVADHLHARMSLEKGELTDVSTHLAYSCSLNI